MKSWREYFPFDEPRLDQVKALDQIIPALKSGKKYILLQLGTGVGKSAIAITVSKWIAENLKQNSDSAGKGGIILTSQKILQDQYSSDFPTAADLRSASNYECLWQSGTSCGEIMRVNTATGGWPCKQARCSPIDELGRPVLDLTKCPYALHRQKFWKNSAGITNYSYMLSAIVHGMNQVDKRQFRQQVFVLDECLRGNARVFVDHGQEITIQKIYDDPTVTHVLSYNQDTDVYEKKRILRKIRTEYDRTCKWIELTVEINNQSTKLTTTSNHKIWTKNRGYVRADELTLDDIIKFDTSHKVNITQKKYVGNSLKLLQKKCIHNHDVKITSIRHISQSNQFKNSIRHYKFNLEIEDNHNFFANSILVSNCHRFEEETRKWSTIFVDFALCNSLGIKFPNVKSLSDSALMKWVENFYKPALMLTITSLEMKIKTAKKSGKNEGKYRALKPILKLYEHLDMKKCQITRCMSDVRGNGNYVVDRNISNLGVVESFEIKPVSVSQSMKDIIYNNADHIVFMSATILDKKEFCLAHGIPINETMYINIDSPFDPKAFGIVYSPIASMKQSEIDKSIPKIIKKVKKILSDHPNEKGIIHTGNFKVSRVIADSIKNERLLIQSDVNKRNEILQFHIESSEPTVLVSPSMMEGLDLRDDLGRFQIICKIPFPYLGDSVVKKIMEKNKKWYNWRTALILIQSVGRCVRNEDDWSKTYILDECFGDFFVRQIKYFPASFSEMIIEEN